MLQLFADGKESLTPVESGSDGVCRYPERRRLIATAGVGVAKSESPNTRLREDQVAALRAHRLAVAKELGVGSRGVTQDIMIAAYQRLADEDLPALVVAVREEREARGKR